MTASKTTKKPRAPRGKAGAPQATRKTQGEALAFPHLLIVGIGASAGGLDAFKKFFANMPTDSGLAFVLVQHLDPHHNSMLVELVGRQTTMAVVEAENGTRVVANRVFIIPPDATLTIADGVLRVTKPAPARGTRKPIDTFFSSLAEDQGENAICIVLSGTGSDGSAGLTAIKEHGGLTMAQAEFDSTAMSGMPHSAAATGLVDQIIPVEDMPAALIEYRNHLIEVAGRKDHDGARRDTADYLPAISVILRAATGHDFNHYKKNTLIRRIQRRMQVLRIDTVPGFIERLRKDAREVELLFGEFLIGVTQFFRDPAAFDTLQEMVIPKLLENKGPDDPIRIWVPGCATGEEVYTIAILLREAMERQSVRLKVQIFGTDIDNAAIAIARAAHYRKAMIGVSPERLERWFTETGDAYSPVKEVREMCVFSTHSVVKDPPFSKLDLVSCRNLLIYLDADLQDRVMRTFHYALRPEGYLFLGQSESVTRNTKLFTTADKKHRIFQRREAVATMLPSFPPFGPTAPTQQGTASPRPSAPTQDRIDNGIRRIMEKHSPAYVVIDRNYDILRFSGGEVGRYLEPTPGMANLNLFGIVRKALRPAVRAAVAKAYAAEDPVTTEKVAIRIDGQNRTVTLLVETIPEGGAEAGLCIVAFQDTGPAGNAKASGDAPHPDVQMLEHELHTTKTQLRATIDELETSNEEMRSANEEYQSVNEELQSSNEELETAKEEMQSINEELETINAEMSGKNEMLTRLNSDLKNLLDSTQIATIFLDNKLRIRNYTPGMTDLFHLRDSDRGRPITEIVTRLNYDDLRRDVTNVLRTLSVIEREVQITDEQSTLIMRVRPYRTVDNVIDGVVITFVDITERKRHEEARALLATIVDSSQDAIIGHSLDGFITSWNGGAETIFGYAAAEAIGKRFSLLLPETNSDGMNTILTALRLGNRMSHFEIELAKKDGTQIDVSLSVSPILDASGKTISASTIAREFTARKLAEEHKSLLMAELDHRVKNTLMIISALITQTLKTTASPEEFETVVQGRIQAMSRVHHLMTQSDSEGANLRELIVGELAPYRAVGGENVVLHAKDDIVLLPKATLTLAMAIHELATNAAKFGALSATAGRIEVTWRVANTAEGPWLSITWVEVGGPPVTIPTRRGFGSQLIERTVGYELQGRVSREFLPEGVRCTFEFPLMVTTGYRRSESAMAND